MGKVSIIIMVVLAFALQGCEAFKSSYNKPPDEVLTNIGAAIDETPEGGGAGEQEFSTDNTVCDTVPGLEITFPDIQTLEDMGNSGWTAEVGDDGKVEADVEKLGDHSVKIVISKTGGEAESLAMTMKQVGKEAINVCNVVYTGCKDGCVGASSAWSDLESGKIGVQQYNMEKGVFNVHYTLEFKESNVGDQGVTLDGAFAIEGFGKSELTE